MYTLADAAAVAAAVFGLDHLISYCNYTKRSFGPTSRGQGRRLCHAMPNYRPGEVNPKQQLLFCCRSPCESRDCCAAVAVPSGSELPSSLMLIQYIIRARHLFFFSPFFLPGPKIRVCWYLCTWYQGYIPPQKRTEGLLMKLLQNNKTKNNLNTELMEMGVFSAVAGNQLPNQLQKRVLPALFHLRCPSQ